MMYMLNLGVVASISFSPQINDYKINEAYVIQIMRCTTRTLFFSFLDYIGINSFACSALSYNSHDEYSGCFVREIERETDLKIQVETFSIIRNNIASMEYINNHTRPHMSATHKSATFPPPGLACTAALRVC